MFFFLKKEFSRKLLRYLRSFQKNRHRNWIMSAVMFRILCFKITIGLNIFHFNPRIAIILPGNSRLLGGKENGKVWLWTKINKWTFRSEEGDWCCVYIVENSIPSKWTSIPCHRPSNWTNLSNLIIEQTFLDVDLVNQVGLLAVDQVIEPTFLAAVGL